MEFNITEIMVALIGSASLGAVFAWFFGGRQSNKNTVDNDSHNREKEFLDIVNEEVDKKVKDTIKKVIKCSESCKHSANCPIIQQWEEESK